ncbi:putative L-type lectin-domain containing receptor kinase S-7 [Nymphaea thermarum]|nr:putative L-type lectin-domain containing receptor kinase S-7 [Nymphaea thermarum]
MKSYSRCYFFLLSLVSFLLSYASCAENASFDFPSFTIRNLTLLGDAYLRNGTIGLTREINVPASSSGSVLYNSPFRFFDPASNSSASFFSRFVFSITNANPGSYGDGITFFLSPNNETIGSPGRFLGLVNSSSPDDNKFIAVEFDTFFDAGLGDPNANHVGLDVGNLSSIQTLDAGSVGIDLKNGTSITAWIEYRNDMNRLMTWMSYTSLKPLNPQFSVDIDLSKYFEEFMYVGFSGSTEGSTELHTIEEWSFQTDGLESKGLSPPHSVATDGEGKPVLGFSQPRCHNQNCWSRKLNLGLKISGSIIICMIMGYLSWVLVKRWRLTRPVKNFKQEMLKGPKNFSYREIRTATRGFNKGNVVGYGASGTVYRGILPESGMTVAVKRSKHANQGMDDFMGELLVIVCLRHRNLVQLEGWCCEKGELLLVYEFMPNGSLDSALYQEDDREVLNWSQRYNIAVGTASALMYLHYECEKQEWP